jgi:ankyrin repeat protein
MRANAFLSFFRPGSDARRLILSVLGISLFGYLTIGCNDVQKTDVVSAETKAANENMENGTVTAEQPVERTAPTKNQPKKTSPAISAEAFQEAALKGQIETVRNAIEQGIDVNVSDSDGRTAHLLAAYDGKTDVVELLLEHDAPVDHVDGVGRTALIYASSGPNHETVIALLKAGADPDVVDKAEGFTALMFAAAEGQKEVVQALLQNNANTTVKDKDGETARDFAEKNGHREVATMLGLVP